MVNLLAFVFGKVIQSFVLQVVLILSLLLLVRMLLRTQSGRIALLSCCMLGAGAYGGVVYQENRMRGEIEGLRVQHTAELERLRDEQQREMQRFQRQKDRALAEAQKVASVNRRAADAARAELDRLRRQQAGFEERVRRASDAAVREYAIAAGTVFERCSEELVRMAEIADGHSTDVRMMLAAWPRRKEEDE